jgi:hypothetical protein
VIIHIFLALRFDQNCFLNSVVRLCLTGRAIYVLTYLVVFIVIGDGGIGYWRCVERRLRKLHVWFVGFPAKKH